MVMNEITMEVRRTIRVGRRYNIAPSLAFSGVLYGTVEVIAIDYECNMENVDARIAIDSYKSAYDEDDMDVYLREELNGLWVAYEYTDGQEEGEVYVFPIGEFTDHTTNYL